MGTKNLILGMVLSFTTVVYSQHDETQIKFQLANTENELDLSQQLNEIEGYQFTFGDTYKYYDIYLDTPEKNLYELGYSLRIRKRVKSESLHTYSMQLKSEATSTSSERVEVEEKELDFYRLIDSEGEIIYLVDLLDSIFNSIGTNNDASKKLNLLESWLMSSANSSITPFQYLRHIDSENFSSESIASLTIQMVGASERKRGYVFVHKNDFKGPTTLGRSKKETPAFFQENKNLVWLMETSLDKSTFYSAYSNEQVLLEEFEIELKHKDKVWGAEMLGAYQNLVKEKLDGTIIKDSKYRQSMGVMSNKNALSKESAF